MVKFYRGLVYDFKEGSSSRWEAKEKKAPHGWRAKRDGAEVRVGFGD